MKWPEKIPGDDMYLMACEWALAGYRLFCRHPQGGEVDFVCLNTREPEVRFVSIFTGRGGREDVCVGYSLLNDGSWRREFAFP